MPVKSLCFSNIFLITICISGKHCSILAGIGYGQRQIGHGNYYTVLMIDLLNNVNSPYRDAYGGVIPIVRAGFNVYLHPKQRK